jgi:hypothetical protein
MVATLVLLLGSLLACTGSPGSTPRGGSPGPGESVFPSVEVDPILCEDLRQVQEELRDLRQTRIRRGIGELLQRRFEDIRVMTDEVDNVTPYELESHLNPLWDAVLQLGLAVEDYRTTNNPGEAVNYIRRSGTQLQRVLTRFRRAAGCLTG